MKNILFTINLLFISSLLLANKGIDESLFEDSKVIKKSYRASSETELEITNKHGNVVFETWDKDSVSIEVVVKVTSDKLEQIQVLLNAVDIRFMNSTDYISVSSIWNSASGFRIDVTKLLGGQKVNVNYVVKLPKNIEVSVNNKFGDVLMDDFEGKLKVDISHGRFVARNLNNLRRIEAQYTKVDIKSCKDGDFILKFSNLRLKEARKLTVDAISSDVKIDNLSFLTIKMTNGNLSMGTVTDIQMVSFMSAVEIEKLIKNLNGSLKFGSIHVENIESNFTNITLDGFSTDIRLDFMSNIYFSYNVELEKGKMFKVPTEGNKLEKENTLGDFKQYEGVFKSNTATITDSKVVIKAKSTYIIFGNTD